MAETHTIASGTTRNSTLAIGAGDMVLVEEGGAISTVDPFGPNVHGIVSTGTDNAITVNGSVHTAETSGAGVKIRSGFITIGETGVISGHGSGIWAGIDAFSANAITNRGAITEARSALSRARLSTPLASPRSPTVTRTATA
jgi:hypothetical protein